MVQSRLKLGSYRMIVTQLVVTTHDDIYNHVADDGSRSRGCVFIHASLTNQTV